MDEADIAYEQELRAREEGIRIARQAAARKAATGTCLNCDEPAPGGALFCSAECRDDAERRDRLAHNRHRSL